MSFPGSAARVTVRGTFVDALGAPLSGKQVRFVPNFKPAGVDLAAHLVVTRNTVTTLTDELGQFSVQLWATDDDQFTPTGFTYTVIEPGGRRYDIPVPADTPGGSLDLSDVVPVDEPSEGSALLLVGPAGPTGPAGANSTVAGPAGSRGAQVEAFTGGQPSLAGHIVGDLAINASTGELIRAKET